MNRWHPGGGTELISGVLCLCLADRSRELWGLRTLRCAEDRVFGGGARWEENTCNKTEPRLGGQVGEWNLRGQMKSGVLGSLTLCILYTAQVLEICSLSETSANAQSNYWSELCADGHFAFLPQAAESDNIGRDGSFPLVLLPHTYEETPFFSPEDTLAPHPNFLTQIRRQEKVNHP